MPAVKPAVWRSLLLAALICVAVATGSARAQDFEGDGSFDLPDKGGGGHNHGHFQGSGKVDVTQTSPCPNGETCFVFTGSVSGGNGPAAFSGNGTNSNCQPRGKKSCCTSAGSVTAEPNGGSVSFNFAGTACSTSTKETLNAHLTCTGGTGMYQGATGSGQVTLTDNPKTGRGTISVSGTLR